MEKVSEKEIEMILTKNEEILLSEILDKVSAILEHLKKMERIIERMEKQLEKGRENKKV